MKPSELRKRTDADLREEAAVMEREIINLRFHAGSEKAAGPQQIRTLRKDLARVKTILRERELAGAASGSDAGTNSAGDGGKAES